MMYLIWLCVLIMAILPLRIGSPSLRFVMQELPDTVTVAADVPSDPGDILIITGADDAPTLDEQRQTLTAYAQTHDTLIGTFKGAVGICISSIMVHTAFLLGLCWAAGFGYRLVTEYAEFRRLRNVFAHGSRDCDDAMITTVFAACRARVGISPEKKIRLRIIDASHNVTPCVIGVFHPTIYLSAFCGTLDETHLEHVLLHELCHIRRNDLVYEYFMVFVLSFHWLCPTCRAVREAITEDIELACDVSVLRITNNIPCYMESILCVAESITEGSGLMTKNGIRHADTAGFMACNTAPSYLKRRYMHMKTTREKKHAKKLYALCAGIMTTVVVANAALLSSCGFIEASELGAPADGIVEAESTYTYDPIDVALRNYFGIPDQYPITAEMYDEIETLDFYILERGDETLSAEEKAYPAIYYQSNIDAVFVMINGEGPMHLMPMYLMPEAMETVIVPALEKNKDPQNIGFEKFRAFYALKDLADPLLEPRAAAEMKQCFPILEEIGAMYVYDPYTTVREEDILYKILCESGIVDTSILNETALMTKIAVNEHLSDVTVQYHTITSDDEFLDRRG